MTGIMLYADDINAFRDLISESELGSVVLRSLDYTESGEIDETGLSTAAVGLLRIIRRKIDRDRETLRRRAEGGSKGGRPPKNLKVSEDSENNLKVSEKNQGSPKNLTVTVPVSVPVSVTDTVPVDTEGKTGAAAPSPAPQAKRFVKPTVEEVREYIREQGYSVDAEAWMAYYESNGWHVGRNPMRDWKAAVRTWSKNGYGSGPQGKAKTVHAQEFTQRQYTDSELEGEMSPLLREALERAQRGELDNVGS